MNQELQQHWNKAYQNSETEKLGWYEANPDKILDLLEKSELNLDSRILVVGAGTSTLIAILVEKGYRNIIANDLSSDALALLKQQLGENSAQVSYIVDDLTKAENLNTIEPVDLWIDRAVLHFFNEASEQKKYFELLDHILKPNGHAIIAVFHLNGAEKCCGLPVHRYDEKLLQEKLGKKYQLKENFDYTFINPGGGERPYIYTLFQKK